MTGRCGFAWGACERCLGQVLDTSGGVARCSRCKGEWPASEVEPCQREAVRSINDHGCQVPACASHALYAKRDAATERTLTGCAVLLYPVAAAAILGAIYLAVRFVRWAWETPLP